VHAVRELLRLGYPADSVRWTQRGFLPLDATGATPRNLMGFNDGTGNMPTRRRSTGTCGSGRRDRRGLRGGTILVARRINIRVARWDESSHGEQERAIGRRKAGTATSRRPDGSRSATPSR
jgi:deferrochelatase/peroxidase EfeB